MKYKAVIFGNCPSKSNCYQVITIGGHSSIGKKKALKEYEEKFLWQIGGMKDLNINCPFTFTMDVYYPSLRPDLDNSLKVVLDCLQKTHTIKNDNKCCEIHARKFVDEINPRIEITIEPVE